MNITTPKKEYDPIRHFYSLYTVSELLSRYSFSTFNLTCSECGQNIEEEMARGEPIRPQGPNEWCLSGVTHCVGCNSNSEISMLILKGKRGHVLFCMDYENPIAISYTSILKRANEYIKANVSRLFKK